MRGELIRFFRHSSCLQIRRARTVDPLDTGDTPGDQAGVLQCTNPQRQIIAFTNQVHGAVAQVYLHIDLGVQLQKLGQQAAQVRHGKRQRRTEAQGAAQDLGLSRQALYRRLERLGLRRDDAPRT